MRSEPALAVLLLLGCEPDPPPSASLASYFTCTDGTVLVTASTDGPVVDVVLTLAAESWLTPLTEIHTGEWEVSEPLEGHAETCDDARMLDWLTVATLEDGRVLEHAPGGLYVAEGPL
jgi:hypothetical protein